MTTSGHIAKLVNGKLFGDPNREIIFLKNIENADSRSVTFISDKKYREALAQCKAGILLTTKSFVDQYENDYILVDDPYLAFAQVSAIFDTEPRVANDIHTSAVIHPSARIGKDVVIGPNAVVGENVDLADGVSIGANATIGHHCQLGANSIIYPGVTLYHEVTIGARCRIHSGTVIGSHGFGYANHKGQWHKIAQIGRVVIGDDVEIAANCAIDRGAIEDTVIEDGVKIDNLVHMAHNVKIGAHTALAGQIGISGSTEIGQGSMAGGQCGFAGHIKTAPGSIFTGQAMVTGNVDKPGVYSSGTGLMQSKDWRKMVARIRNLDELFKIVRRLEKKMHGNESKSQD